jgi:hypothetical protein
MTDDEHIAGLGKLLANLHSLELTLRIFLLKPTDKWDGNKIALFLSRAPNPFAKASSLIGIAFVSLSTSSMIHCRRRSFPCTGSTPPSFARDAIAHGRLCAKVPEFPLTLWRFGKPNESGTVSVEQAAGGALLGRAADAINLEDLTGFFDKVSRELPPGNTAIVAEVTEQTQGNLDTHIQAIGGTIIRE